MMNSARCALGLSVSLAALVLMSGCNPVAPKKGAQGATPSAGASSSALPSLRISGHGTAGKPVRIVQQKGNREQYELLAHSYESVGAQGRSRGTFQHAQVTFFGRSGSKLVATAPQAIVDEAANTVTLIGGVHAVTGTGMTLTCKTLEYSRATEMLHGNGNVVAGDAHGFSATGSSFDANISLSQLRMQ